MLPPGTDCGQLSAEAATQLGLAESTHVATSLIDAHAGGLALVSAQAKVKEDLIGRLGMGTPIVMSGIGKGVNGTVAFRKARRVV